MGKNLFRGLIVAAALLCTSPAAAHTLWINLYESFSHPPGHAIASIGWGHALPMDDLVNMLKLESYAMVGPDMKQTALPLPDTTAAKPVESKSGLKVVSGDVGVRKLSLTDQAAQGTYQVTAVSQDNFYTMYLDDKGKSRWALKSMDQVTGAKKILAGMKYKAVAKSYFTVKKWSEPKPLGHELEIVPLTDLSNLHVGDRVDFQITFMGKPLDTMPAKSIEYITATSNTFGGPDGFALSAMIFKGKGGFRLPTAGQWLINVYTRQEVTPDNEMKHLAKKCTVAMYSSSVTINVKP